MKHIHKYIVGLLIAVFFVAQPSTSHALSCVGPVTAKEVVEQGNYENAFIGTVLKHDREEKRTVFEVTKGWGEVKDSHVVTYGDLSWGENFGKGSERLVFVMPLDEKDQTFVSGHAKKMSAMSGWGLSPCTTSYSVKQIDEDILALLGESNILYATDEKTLDKATNALDKPSSSGIPWVAIGIGGSVLVILYFVVRFFRNKRNKD